MILNIVAVTLLAGFASGLLYGLLNILFVTPYIEKAVELEAIRSGFNLNQEYFSYRAWQLQGGLLAALLAGIAYSALYTLVYILSKSIDKGVKRAVILASIIWIVIYLMPAIKYPANPPAVGDPDTIYYRQIIFVTYMLISGISALALALIRVRLTNSNNKIRRDAAIITSYSLIMFTAYMLMPNNPDPINIDSSILLGFRVSSALTVLVLWLMLGLTSSLLWSKSGLIKRRLSLN
jgi:predicted cobalt transporter CbtA